MDLRTSFIARVNSLRKMKPHVRVPVAGALAAGSAVAINELSKEKHSEANVNLMLLCGAGGLGALVVCSKRFGA